MPTESSLAGVVVNASISGAKEAVTAAVPEVFFRAYHRLLHAETTLRGADEIEIFNHLVAELEPICNPTDTTLLPEIITHCWRVFKFEALPGPVYQLTGVPDMKKCKAHYATYTPIEGRVRVDFPLTGSVLGILSGITSVQRDATQTIAKIVFGYICFVAVVLTEIDAVVVKYEVIEMLKKVTNVLLHGERYRAHFDQDMLQGLRALQQVFDDYINIPHPTRDGEIIPQAFKRLQRHQLEIVAKVFRTLLVMTEGANKPDLTISYPRIAAGLLEDGQSTKTFHPKNPFQDLLRVSASVIERLHTQNLRDTTITEQLALPSLDEIKGYLRESLSCGMTLGNSRHGHGNDGVLYLLQQSIPEHSKEVVWANAKSDAVIDASAEILLRVADGLRLHLYVADKIVYMNFIMQIIGQSWLANEGESSFLRHLLLKYEERLNQFEKESCQIHAALSRFIRPGDNLEHGIMALFGRGLAQDILHLREQGLKPLLNIGDRFTRLIECLVEARSRFLMGMGLFLNESGYGFAFNVAVLQTRVSAQNPLKASRVISLKIEKIKRVLTDYASKHQYPIDLRTLEAPVLENRGKEHQVRAEWIKHFLLILNSVGEEEALLFTLTNEMWRLKHSKDWSHFTSLKGTNIQTHLEEIEGVIHRPTADDAPLLQPMKGECKQDAMNVARCVKEPLQIKASPAFAPDTSTHPSVAATAKMDEAKAKVPKVATVLGLMPQDKVDRAALPLYHIADVLLNFKPLAQLPPGIRDQLSGAHWTPKSALYSKLHTDICKDFLVANQDLVRWKDTWVFLRLFSPFKMPKLRQLYARINALLRYLYSNNAPKPGETLSLDRLLVEQVLQSAMAYYYTEIYEEPCFAYCVEKKANPNILVNENQDGTLNIQWGEHMLSFATCLQSEADAAVSQENQQLRHEKEQLQKQLMDRELRIKQLEEAEEKTRANEARQSANHTQAPQTFFAPRKEESSTLKQRKRAPQ